MKKQLLVIALLISTYTQAQLNLTFRSQHTYPTGSALANIGGYVDSLGNEYALVGWSSGLDIVDVTNPVNPIVKQTITGATSDWREVKTWSHYAYVTTEGGSNGLQIIDLSNLPGTVISKYWKGSGAIANQLNKTHALHIDNNGFLFLYGNNSGSLFNGAAVIATLADPWNPVYLGHTTGTYVHDGYAYGDTLWACNINDGYFSVWNVSNKANPILLQTQQTPGIFTHNAWLNDQHTVLFTTDEISGSYLTAYDITNLSNITELSRIQLTPGSGSIIHNTHTLNDFEVISWYKDGIAIVDVSHPDNMIVTGWYDTYTQGSGDGFNGCWGVYPFLPSGNIVASDIDNGLFVLTPTYVRGCYLEGNVTDSVTGIIINGATVTLVGQNISKLTDLSGNYKTGLATAGLYTVQVSKAGYYTKTFSNVNLNNGQLTNLNAALIPVVLIAISGNVIDNLGNPVPNALTSFIGSLGTYNAVCDANGQFTIPSFVSDMYNVTAGKWGYINTCSSQIVNGVPFTITINPGYYDDFSLNFNWTASGASPNIWERAIPVATLNGLVIANPGNDVVNDCGDLAFVTDNGGGGPWTHDVDFGSAILTSPLFDATLYIDPYLNYKRWYYNGGNSNGNPNNNPNDTMKVYLNNGLSSVLLETANPSSPDNSTWADRSFRISNFITPTNSMSFIITVRDSQPVSNIVEGGLDLFTITEGVTSVSEHISKELLINAQPNPFNSQIKIQYSLALNEIPATITVSDILGHEVLSYALKSTTGEFNTGEGWSAGIYFVKLTSPQGIKTLLISKSEK